MIRARVYIAAEEHEELGAYTMHYALTLDGKEFSSYDSTVNINGDVREAIRKDFGLIAQGMSERNIEDYVLINGLRDRFTCRNPEKLTTAPLQVEQVILEVIREILLEK